MNITMELDSFYYGTWFEMGRSDITVTSISVDPNKSYKRGNFLRAYLHGTTLSHATSLRQAYDMT